MIDMSAAFDAVDHTILLNRLSKCFGITYRLTALSWFKSYLSNRNQCVSEPRLLSSGVPQGFMLAPLLFNLNMKRLAILISKLGFSYHFYTDDVQFCITFNHANAFDANVITNCLKAVEQWLTTN